MDRAEEQVAAAEQAMQAADPDARLQSAQDAENTLAELAAEIKSSLPDSQQQGESQPGGRDAEAGEAGRQSKESDQSSSDPGTPQGMPQDDPAGSQDESTMFDSRTGDNPQDSDVLQRRFHDETWFAKLPPALQRAIQTRTRRPAPRGYERRLRRYFQQVD